MHDLGKFEPKGAHGPLRLEGGITMLGRLTTTEEQRTETIEWMLKQMQAAHEHEAQATVYWTRGEATVLVLEARIEDIVGAKLYLEDRVSERTLAGAEIRMSPIQRQARLKAEVTELAERKML